MFHHSVASNFGLFQTQDAMTIYVDSVGSLRYETTFLPNGRAKYCPVSTEPTPYYDCGVAGRSHELTCFFNDPEYRTLAPWTTSENLTSAHFTGQLGATSRKPAWLLAGAQPTNLAMAACPTARLLWPSMPFRLQCVGHPETN